MMMTTMMNMLLRVVRSHPSDVADDDDEDVDGDDCRQDMTVL